jgi:hypothetical protein
MGSVLSTRVSPSGADGAAGSSEGMALDITPELREQIKVARAHALPLPGVRHICLSGGDQFQQRRSF